jgi:hypothetical protein
MIFGRIRPLSLSQCGIVLKMLHSKTRKLATLSLLAIGAAAMVPGKHAIAQPRFEISIPKSLQPAADDSAFASRKDAEEFLAQHLPSATAANPKYRSENAGNETAWITKTIKFGPGENGSGTLVSMSEEILEFHEGVRVATGSHEVAFLIEDVKIAERTDSTDRTETGDAALGIIFNCNSGKCIQSSYGGKPSTTDWADIYIQETSMRGKILKAFEALKQGT